MARKIEVIIDVIIHATEDISKFLENFKELFEIGQEEISIQNLRGHFDNPITLLNIKLSKKKAENFVKILAKGLPQDQLNEIINNIEARTVESTLHVRLAKQKLVQGKLELDEKDPVKVKIITPIYNKKEVQKIFTDILSPTN